MASQTLAVGVTGAIGVGKSSVIGCFAARGCVCLTADSVVHDLYRDPSIRDTVAQRLGTAILDPSGAVDRAALGQRVFGNPTELAWLEGFVHPLVTARMLQWMSAERARMPRPALIVYESPLLFEADLADAFDRVLVITADDSVRAQRLALRGALTAQSEREARMWSDAQRTAAADDVIDNSGSPSALQDQVDAYIDRYAGP